MEKPTKFIVENNRVISSFEPVNPEDVSIMVSSRMEICNDCEFFSIMSNGSYRCTQINGDIKFMTNRIYPLDEDNKAFRQINPSGYYYVCPLKKW